LRQTLFKIAENFRDFIHRGGLSGILLAKILSNPRIIRKAGQDGKSRAASAAHAIVSGACVDMGLRLDCLACFRAEDSKKIGDFEMKTHSSGILVVLFAVSLCLLGWAQRGGGEKTEGQTGFRGEGPPAAEASKKNQPMRDDVGPGVTNRPDGRRVFGWKIDVPLEENDPDYQTFYKYVPRDDFKDARLESCPVKPVDSDFQYPDLTYPMGDKNPESYRFDMGPADAPVKKGWTRITKDNMFTYEKGFGWSKDKPANDFAYEGRFFYQKGADYAVVQNQGIRRAFENAGRDCAIASIRQAGGPHTLDFYEEYLDEATTDAVLDPDQLAFKVALPDGRYLVTLVLGDLQIPRYGIDVYANGELVASNIFTGLVQFRGYTEPASPWPVRISFPVNAVRRNIRIALRPNINNFVERCETEVETPDYNFSQLAYGRPNPVFGKRLAVHGPPTQMAISAITISPYDPLPITMTRQRLFPDRDLTQPDALAAVDKFNAGDIKGAEAGFDKVPDSETMTKALGYLAIVGLFDTPLTEEERLLNKSIALLEKRCASNPDDVRSADLLNVCKLYNGGVWRKIHASDMSASVAYPEAACLFNWTTPNEIMYSKALAHYGRCFSTIDAHRWTPTWHLAEEAFLKLEQIEPRNKITGYYINKDITGWDFKDYTPGTEGAPKWAVQLREGYGRLIDQIEWWGENRQRPDGGIGGGWGDDVEVGLIWEAGLLLNPDGSEKARETVRGIAEGVWHSGEVDRDRGFFDGLADVEHTAEWTGDSQAFMIGVEYGNPTYFERNLKAAKLMRDLWMGESDLGHLHFKSMMLGNKRIGEKDGRGGGVDARTDVPLNGRAAMQASWNWWYCPNNDGINDLMSRWAEAWYEDSKREENGKPAWVIPGPIGFPSDTIGGNGETKWARGIGAYENPTYTEYTLNLFAAMYDNTRDEKWLKPKAAAMDNKAIVEGKFNTVDRFLKPLEITDKYAALDAIPNRFGEGTGIQSILDGFPARWPSCTSEASQTDRIGLAGTVDIVTFMLGGNIFGGLRFAPMTLKDTSRNITQLPLKSNEKEAKAIFFNFNTEDEPVEARFWRLQVGGEYKIRLGIDDNDDDLIDTEIQTFTYEHKHRGDSIKFIVPARKTAVLEVEQTKEGKGMPDRVIDLAASPDDIEHKDGKLNVTVHNIGNQDCGKFSIRVWQGEAGSGKLLETLEIAGLEAPNDLEARTVTKSIGWTLPSGASLENPVKITLEIDPADDYYEITEINNIISQSVPRERESYRTPRVWPSLAEEYPNHNLTKYQQFPEGFPEEEIR
jgi:hypothetical protein